MRKILLRDSFFVLFTLLFIVSCSDDENNQDVIGDSIKFDLADAIGVFIAPVSKTKSNENSANKIFKITNEGFVLEVKIEDEDGDDITDRQTPIDIRVMSPNYLDVLFEGR